MNIAALDVMLLVYLKLFFFKWVHDKVHNNRLSCKILLVKITNNIIFIKNTLFDTHSILKTYSKFSNHKIKNENLCTTISKVK